MEAIKQEITGFVYSNIDELWDEWSPTTTYILEDEESLTNASMVLYNGYYYRSLTNNNLNKNPETYNKVYWIKTSISNRNAMIDISAKSKSIKEDDDLIVIFEQNSIAALGIGYYDAGSVLIEILASDMITVIDSFNTEDMTNSEVTDYWSYIYSEYGVSSDRAIYVKLPSLGDYIRVTFTQGGGISNPACGFLFGGLPIFMGNTVYGVSFNFNSYAIKETDDIGTLTIKKGAVQDLVDFECDIESRYMPQLRRDIKKFYNEIVMFVLDERDTSEYENLITLGVIQSANPVLENVVLSTVSYSVMEAI